MNAATPTRATTFHALVVAQLGRDIGTGRYPPGALLPSEPELGVRFGYSRIVIREAIKSLVAKGMLQVGRRVGTLVRDTAHWNLFDPDVIAWRAASADFDTTMARDLTELRRIVEPAAVRLAAERASADERRQLLAEHRWPLIAIGVVSGAAGALPGAVWLGGVMAVVFFPFLAAASIWLYVLVFIFTALWFAYYCLEALARMRAAEAMKAAPPAAEF